MSEVEHPFPPTVISKWLASKTVSADALIEEFRYWGNRMAGGDGSGPFPESAPSTEE